MGRSRIALLRKGELPVLPGEEREEGRGGKVESVLFFQVPLKPTLSHGRAGPRGSHPIKN
jgi:hypothetical protein